MRYDTGFELGLIAFTAAVLGGIGNLTGAVVGVAPDRADPGLQRGALRGSRRAVDWTRSLVFAILIAILVFRPEGPARRTHAGGALDGASSAPVPCARLIRRLPRSGREAHRPLDAWRRLRRGGSGALPNLIPFRDRSSRSRSPTRSTSTMPADEHPGDPDASRPSHDAVTILVFVDDGRRAERGRRLRGAARSRLRRLLRDRRLHARAGSPPASSSRSASTSAPSASSSI
mgnify:CR=1 FL=1